MTLYCVCDFSETDVNRIQFTLVGGAYLYIPTKYTDEDFVGKSPAEKARMVTSTSLVLLLLLYSFKVTF